VTEPNDARNCATCNGWIWIEGRWVRRRETRGMVCTGCGWDYARDGEPNAEQAPDATDA
jgi:hypothetical protein